ncbi:MAG TPA: hypothetical protein VEI97_00960 [bacterium]|nr:hypothetical protein [bacterium]
MAHYYLAAISSHNYAVLQQEGFRRYGFKHLHRLKHHPAKGDKVIFYIKGGPKSLAGIAIVAGNLYEPDPGDLLWSAEDGPFLPHRFDTRPDITLDPADGAPIQPLVPDLALFRHGAIKNWSLVLHTQNQEIAPEDYRVIRRALQAAARRAAR